jgi:hypothetical protein
MIIIFVECYVECKNVTIVFISQFLFPPCLYATELVYLTDARFLLVEMKIGKMSIMLCMRQFPPYEQTCSLSYNNDVTHT